MSKLPSIFHNSGKFITNNRNTYSTFNKEKKEIINNEIENYINYFNKKITVVLKDGREITGTLISKRNDLILLDTNDYINIKDISYIK